MTPSPGQISISNSFVSLFIFYILSYLLSKTMGCLSVYLVSFASVQKLFCGICSAFKLSFDEFVGEKLVSPSYSSAILGQLLRLLFRFLGLLHWLAYPVQAFLILLLSWLGLGLSQLKLFLLYFDLQFIICLTCSSTDFACV